ncbi:MAG: YraN family protein [Gammaproteobacteria bacterium]|nr:YraN family protein [Gammaproteobacteria bacterium]
MKPNQKIGQLAESFACRYLQRQGLRLLKRNYATRFGEIDLIMCRKSLLIFVEVRLRNHCNRVSGKESVDYFKQQRLIKTAQHYLQSQP